LALTVVMYLCLNFSVWITVAQVVPAAGFLLRTFIVFHDALMARSCPQSERTAGDLNRRGTGDVLTLTVDEYISRP
jgi:acyl-lipid omega-6 desaturase (Delta-12 desaturase)